MKNLKFFSYLIVFSTLFFTSCTKENLDYRSTAREIISSGRWSVDYYFQGQNKSAQFDNYQFNFLGNGTLSATNGSVSINGTWSVVRDVNRNEVLRINIQESFFRDLNEQWNVTGTDSYSVSMKTESRELRLRKQ